MYHFQIQDCILYIYIYELYLYLFVYQSQCIISFRGLVVQTEYIKSKKTEQPKKLVVTLFDGTHKEVSDGRLKGADSRKNHLLSVDVDKIPDELLMQINFHKHGVDEFARKSTVIINLNYSLILISGVHPGDIIQIVSAKCKDRRLLKSGQWDFPANGGHSYVLHYSGIDFKSYETKGKSSGIQIMATSRCQDIITQFNELFQTEIYNIHSNQATCEAVGTDSTFPISNGLPSVQIVDTFSQEEEMEIDHM